MFSSIDVITGGSHGNSGNHAFSTTTAATTPATTQKSTQTSTSSLPSTIYQDVATLIRLSNAIVVKQSQSAGTGNSETTFQYFQNGKRLKAQKVGIQNAFQTF